MDSLESVIERHCAEHRAHYELLDELAALREKAGRFDSEMAVTVREIADVLREHERVQRHYGPDDSLPGRLRQVLERYQSAVVTTVENAQQFRDDLIVQMRALSLVVDMTGSAGTHREKAARLRGLSELIEGGIAQLREMHFESMTLHRWKWPDVFRSDFPTRVHRERIRELEARLAENDAENSTASVDGDRTK